MSALPFFVQTGWWKLGTGIMESHWKKKIFSNPLRLSAWTSVLKFTIRFLLVTRQCVYRAYTVVKVQLKKKIWSLISLWCMWELWIGRRREGLTEVNHFSVLLQQSCQCRPVWSVFFLLDCHWTCILNVGIDSNTSHLVWGKMWKYSFNLSYGLLMFIAQAVFSDFINRATRVRGWHFCSL